MSFHVGQKVVCVDNQPRNGQRVPGAIYPDVGPVYTVRDVLINRNGNEGILLREIRNDPAIFGWTREPCFLSSHFRPVVEKSTDTGMAILREILDRESFEEKKPSPVKCKEGQQ